MRVMASEEEHLLGECGHILSNPCGGPAVPSHVHEQQRREWAPRGDRRRTLVHLRGHRHDLHTCPLHRTASHDVTALEAFKKGRWCLVDVVGGRTKRKHSYPGVQCACVKSG